MKELRIPKKDGTYRLVVCPSKAEKKNNRRLIPKLTNLMLLMDIHKVCHGFVPTRSPVTNAKQHIGYEYSLCFDLKNFFDTVSVKLLIDNKLDWLFGDTLDKSGSGCFCAGKSQEDTIARQGIPTSPIIANIAFSLADKKIAQLIERFRERGYRIVYTRYADDLTFSFDDPKLIRWLRMFVPACCKRFGFEVNRKKTHCQWAKNGRRNITGVMVDDKQIYPTLKIRRRYRAAIHRKRHKQINGLGEWCKLKEPRWYDRVIDLFQKGSNSQIQAMLIKELHT